ANVAHSIGTFSRSIEVEGETREYLIYVPNSYDTIKSIPVMLNFHGWTMSARNQMEVSDMRALSEQEEFISAEKALPQDWPIMRISAFKGTGLDELKDFIYDNLGFMRIFLKPQGQEADLEEPLIVKDDSTVENVCNNLHRDFVRKFRFARVKGPSAKFDWQRVGLDHQLKDGDLLSIIIKR
ncbi:MAG: TGS domain-containing protein, partial [Candidatus Poseidoniaceae archaeon]